MLQSYHREIEIWRKKIRCYSGMSRLREYRIHPGYIWPMGSSSRNLAAVILKRLEFCRTTIQQNISVGKSKLRPLPGLREDEHDRHDEEDRVDAAAAAAAAATAAVVVVVLSSAAIVAVADARVGVVAGLLSFIHPVRHHRQYQ